MGYATQGRHGLRIAAQITRFRSTVRFQKACFRTFSISICSYAFHILSYLVIPLKLMLQDGTSKPTSYHSASKKHSTSNISLWVSKSTQLFQELIQKNIQHQPLVSKNTQLFQELLQKTSNISLWVSKSTQLFQELVLKTSNISLWVSKNTQLFQGLLQKTSNISLWVSKSTQLSKELPQKKTFNIQHQPLGFQKHTTLPRADSKNIQHQPLGIFDSIWPQKLRVSQRLTANAAGKWESFWLRRLEHHHFRCLIDNCLRSITTYDAPSRFCSSATFAHTLVV